MEPQHFDRCQVCRQRELTPQSLDVVGNCLRPYTNLQRITSFDQAPEEAQLLMRSWQRGETNMVALRYMAITQHRDRLRGETQIQITRLDTMLTEFETVLAQGNTGQVRRARLQDAMRSFNIEDLRNIVANNREFLNLLTQFINTYIGFDLVSERIHAMTRNRHAPY